MRMIVLGLALLVAATPALGQTTAPRQQRDEGNKTDHPKAGDFLWPAIKLLQDAKRRADEEKRRKEEEAQVPPVTPLPEPEPVATTPTQDIPPRAPVAHKPRVPNHTVRVVAVPKPRPDPEPAPNEAAQPTQTPQRVATSPPAELHPSLHPVKPPAAASAPTPPDRSWPMGAWSIAAALLLLLLAAAYAARRVLFPAGPLPEVRAQVDAGTVSEPQFEEALPSMSLMIGSGAFTTSDYPVGASAS